LESKKTVRLHRFILWLSWCAFISLASRPQLPRLPSFLMYFALGTAAALLLPRQAVPIPRFRPNAVQAVLMLLFATALFFVFRGHWIPFYKFRSQVARLGLSWVPLINALAVVGALCSLPLQWKLLFEEGRLLRRAEAAARTGEPGLGRVSMGTIRVFLIAAIACLHLYALQFGSAGFPQNLVGIRFGYFLVNLGMFLSVSLALALVLRRWRYAMLASSVLFAVWGVANYYVFQLHGGPLVFSELANTKTALNVLSEYRLTVTQIPWVSLGFIVMSFRLVRTLWIVDRALPGGGWKRDLVRLGLLAANAALVSLVLLGPGAEDLLTWSRGSAVSHYGFGACVVDDVKRLLHPYRVPEGYDRFVLPEPVTAEEPGQTPDIILILNETFCDLEVYASLRPDRDYLAPFYGIEGAFYGHAVTPTVGGGTNNSEFELLTGNSLYLLNAPAPFNYVDFTRVNSNVVQYLERLGYTTCAMHFQSANNYSRNIAYPAMGFDVSMLGSGYPVPNDRYGNRGGLDASYYAMLNAQYDAYAGDEPRFMYVLTIQNHGGYSRNPPELDTVRARTDFGDLDEDVNEFLSSVALSGEAFRDLTERYAQVDRPVIICMVGDHAPSFITSLATDREWSEREEQLVQRTVPYVIWSNFDADFSSCGEIVSMFSLMPEVLSAAGLPLTTYYRTILELQRSFPVLVSNGYYLDSRGDIGVYSGDDPLCEPITEYYCLAYHALAAGEDYREELFLPQ